MHAAVVTAFDQPPSYTTYDDPLPAGEHDAVVDVLAAGLHPRVRSQADGSHYTSSDALPLVPGIDGVGRTEDGQLRYFILPDTSLGSMAQRTTIDIRRSIPLPDGTDPVRVAAAMNPLMSSWVALRRRVHLATGQRVVVLGATGNAGRLAVQVAKHLGASHVTAVGRDEERLAQVGADHAVRLDDAQALGVAGADVDLVIDYVWGKPTADALRAIIPARTDDAQQLTWIQIGSVGGLESPIPSAALRAARLSIVGSGQGSVPARDFLSELPALVDEIAAGTFSVDAAAVHLADVESVWNESSAERVVLVP